MQITQANDRYNNVRDGLPHTQFAALLSTQCYKRELALGGYNEQSPVHRGFCSIPGSEVNCAGCNPAAPGRQTTESMAKRARNPDVPEVSCRCVVEDPHHPASRR